MSSYSVCLLSLGGQSEPRFELRCSSDVIHIRTCSDSCAALMNLIQYVASYGDLLPPTGQEAKSCIVPQRPKVNKITLYLSNREIQTSSPDMLK